MGTSSPMVKVTACSEEGLALVQKSRRCFLPVLFTRGAVADEEIAEGAASGDVVRIVLVVDVLEAGYAGGGIVELKLRVLKGLSGSEWSEGEGRSGKGGWDRKRKCGPSEKKVSACNVAQCIYYAI